MGHPFFYTSSRRIDRLKCLFALIDVLHFNTEILFRKDDDLYGIERVETRIFNEEALLETTSFPFVSANLHHGE